MVVDAMLLSMAQYWLWLTTCQLMNTDCQLQAALQGFRTALFDMQLWLTYYILSMTHTWSQLIITCWYATWIVSEYYWSVVDCSVPNYCLAINSYKIPITRFVSFCRQIPAYFLKLLYLLRCEKFTFKSEGEKLAGFPPSSFCVENGYPETHIEVCFLCTFCANTPNMKSECFV